MLFIYYAESSNTQKPFTEDRGRGSQVSQPSSQRPSFVGYRYATIPWWSMRRTNHRELWAEPALHIDATCKTRPINTSAEHEKAQYSIYTVARPTTGRLARHRITHGTSTPFQNSPRADLRGFVKKITRHSYSVANSLTKRDRTVAVQSTQSFLSHRNKHI